MFYWILEYGKVLAAYVFIMYLWPSVVFRKYLSQKGAAFRFSFCTTFMILLLNTTVLMLGIVKLLYQWIICILFFGPLLYIAGAWIYRNRAKAIHIKYLLTNICSFRRFTSMVLNRIGIAIKKSYKKLRDMIGPHLLVYILLAVAVIYGMIYFSYGAFHERFYGTTDIYVHHSWIDMLLEGRIFGAGVYPEGMHCFIYGMHTLFGVEVYSCLQFIAGIHISAFLVAVYLFLKEVLPWKYSGILAVILYLIIELDSTAHIGGMARLQWALPQEFALFTVFLCGAYLLRFLRQGSAARTQWKRWKFLRDENLLIFMMALAVSLAVHFYVTIMAFFLCAAIAVFFLFWVFAKKKFVPLMIAILCGVVLAATPMLVARATGIEFQASIDWALSVIEDSQNEMKDPEKETQPQASGPNWSTIDPDEIIGESPKPSVTDQEESRNYFKIFYESTFLRLYSIGRAPVLAILLILGIVLGVACHVIALIRRRAAIGEDPYCGYLFLTAATLVFLTLFAAPELGLLELIQIGRLGTMTHFLTLAMIMIPLDLIMTHIERKGSPILMDLCGLTLSVAMCVSVIASGSYHGYLHFVYSRYPAAVEITNRIIQEMKPETYTIVSPVDELYHVKGYGFHEETVRFIQEMKKDSYTLPTEYVFIFIEKQPIEYAHVHLMEGPAWLAREDYATVFGIDNCSQCPDVKHTEISDEYANKNISIPPNYDSYKNSLRRTVIFSRMNQWVEQFQKLYPHQLVTVYEDDAFVCYMFKQNPARLLELAIMD